MYDNRLVRVGEVVIIEAEEVKCRRVRDKHLEDSKSFKLCTERRDAGFLEVKER